MRVGYLKEKVLQNYKMSSSNLLNLRREKIKYLIKGLRYSLGYSLLDMHKVGLATGLVGNWECGLCLPSKKNLEIVENLIKKSGKNYEELIKLGNLNFGNLIKNMAKRLGISEQILIRFVISKYTRINGINNVNKLKEGKIDLAPKTKLTLLKLKERIQKNNKEVRKNIFEFQKEKTFSSIDNLKVLILVTEYLKSQKRLLSETKFNYTNSSSSDWLHNRANVPNNVLSRIQSTYLNLLIKIEEQIKNRNSIVHQQWNRAENYPEVIGFQYRNDKFENHVFELFDNICSNLIKNALVTDKDFNYITEIDLIGDYKDKRIYLMCKDNNKHQIINCRKAIKKNIELVQKYLKPDIIFLVASCNYPYDKKYFEDCNAFFIDITDLNKIRKTKGILHIFSKKDQKKTDNNIHDLETFRINNKLSKIQLVALLSCSKYLYRRLDKKNDLSNKNEKRLENIKKIDNIRKLHFMANMNLALRNEKAAILKNIRKYLGITVMKMAANIGVNHQYITNLENGRKVSKHLENKIKNYLKSFRNFELLKEKAKNSVEIQKELWEKSKSFDKIINFKGKPVNGDKLENEAVSILTSKGYSFFRNVILANEDLSFKKEVDIYAIKDGKEIIVECTENKNNIKWKNKAELLSEISNELKCDVILVSTKISSFGKKVLKTRGVSGVNIKEL